MIGMSMQPCSSPDEPLFPVLLRRAHRALVYAWGWFRYQTWYKWQARQAINIWQAEAKRRAARRRRPRPT